MMPNNHGSCFLLLDIQGESIKAVSVVKKKAVYCFRGVSCHCDDPEGIKESLKELINDDSHCRFDIAVTIPDDWLFSQKIELDSTLNEQDILDFVLLERGRYFPELSHDILLDSVKSEVQDAAFNIYALEKQRLEFLEGFIEQLSAEIVLIESKTQSLERLSQKEGHGMVLEQGKIEGFLQRSCQFEFEHDGIEPFQCCFSLLFGILDDDFNGKGCVNLAPWRMIHRKRQRKRQMTRWIKALLVCAIAYFFIALLLYVGLYFKKRSSLPIETEVSQLEQEFAKIQSLYNEKQKLLNLAQYHQPLVEKSPEMICAISYMLGNPRYISMVNDIQLFDKAIHVQGRTDSYQNVRRFISDLAYRCKVDATQNIHVSDEELSSDVPKIFSVEFALL